MPDSVSKSLAVIDATDAVVLAPEATPVALTPEQQKTLGTCEFQLHRLGRRIAAREADLIYLYVEFGWHLARAQAIHLTKYDTVSRLEDGRFNGPPPGFKNWLESSEVNIHPRMAYRYIQAASNAGLTADSSPEEVKALREASKLAGQTLTALCRKPVDKTEKQAEIHEVTPEEEEAERLSDLKKAYHQLGQFLTEDVIAEQTWADLSPEEIEAFAGFLADAARVVKAGVKKAKALPAPAAAPLPEKASEAKAHPWRVGQRTGQSRWQVKQAPGWKVAHEADSIHEAAGWLRGQGVDLGTVDVLLAGGSWPTLDKHLETLPTNTEPDGDRVCTQADIARGLWWWGWIGFRGEVMLKTFTGDMKPVVEARGDRRIGKTVVGPFYAQYLPDAEKIVREQDIHAKI